MKAASAQILSEIKRKKIISFARFMELALYCPNVGFYEQEADNIGKHGDFFTSVSVGSLFGELLAFQFGDWLEEIISRNKNNATKTVILETGAHDGKLARDILMWLQERRPQLFEKLSYLIVEPSERRRDWQRETFGELVSKVVWVSSLKTMNQDENKFAGIFFSNEFFDALPVKRLGWDFEKQQWFEWGVMTEKGRFVWMRMPKSPVFLPDCVKQMQSALASHSTEFPEGFTVEVCAPAIQWWKQAGELLSYGKILAIDYGFTREEIFPHRSAGTLSAYYKHRLATDVLANPGEQDITAHVDFGTLQMTGENLGLKTEAFMTQEKFLNGIVAKIAAKPGDFVEWNSARVRQLQTLTHPEHLGRRFRVLVQSR